MSGRSEPRPGYAESGTLMGVEPSYPDLPQLPAPLRALTDAAGWCVRHLIAVPMLTVATMLLDATGGDGNNPADWADPILLDPEDDLEPEDAPIVTTGGTVFFGDGAVCSERGVWNQPTPPMGFGGSSGGRRP